MKKIKALLFILIAILFIPNAFASDNITTYERTLENKYRVNKKWKVTDDNLSFVLKTPSVDASKKIYDFSLIISDEEEQELKKYIDEFIGKYKTELIIVTYDLPYTNDSENENFASDFYDYNDFGIDFDKYDGIVLFRNTYGADPYYDMYTFGNAQLYFSKSDYNYILDDIFDKLHSGDYFSGFKMFIDDVNDCYMRGISSDLKNYYVDENGFLKRIFNPSYFIISIISLIITACTTVHFVKKNKMVKNAVDASMYLDTKSVKYSVKEDKLINKHLSKYIIPSNSSSSGGGYHSSGGSSGGGHSSGGGRHG